MVHLNSQKVGDCILCRIIVTKADMKAKKSIKYHKCFSKEQKILKISNVMRNKGKMTYKVTGITKMMQIELTTSRLFKKKAICQLTSQDKTKSSLFEIVGRRLAQNKRKAQDREG